MNKDKLTAAELKKLDEAHKAYLTQRALFAMFAALAPNRLFGAYINKDGDAV